MNKNIIIVLAVAALFYIVGITDNSDKTGFYNKIGNQDYLEKSFDKLLLPIFNDLKKYTKIDKNFSLNSKYSDDHINIYVIDSEKIKDNRVASKELSQCRNNFSVVKDNIICIDAFLIADMIAESGREFFNFNAIEAYELLNFDIFKNDRRFLNIKELKEEEKKLTSTENNKRYVFFLDKLNTFQRLGMFSETLLEDNKKDGVNYNNAMSLSEIDNNFERMDIRGFLRPIIAHELSHIQDGQTGEFFSIKEYTLDNIFKLQKKISEDKADKFSVEIIDTYLKDNIFDYIDSQDASKKYNHIRRYIDQKRLLLTFIRYFRDKVLFSTFNGFRGIDAKDLFVELYIRNPEELEEWERNFPYYYYSSVNFVNYKKIPIMSDQEYNELITRLVKYGSKTHTHMFYRMNDIYKLLYQDNPIKSKQYLSEVEPYLSFLETSSKTISGEKILRMQGLEKYKKNMNVTKEELFETFNLTKFKKSKFFSINKCHIGSNEAYDDIHIEVCGDKEIYYSKIRFKIENSTIKNMMDRETNDYLKIINKLSSVGLYIKFFNKDKLILPTELLENFFSSPYYYNTTCSNNIEFNVKRINATENFYIEVYAGCNSDKKF